MASGLKMAQRGLTKNTIPIFTSNLGIGIIFPDLYQTTQQIKDIHETLQIICYAAISTVLGRNNINMDGDTHTA